MKKFEEHVLSENFLVDALGHIWMSLVGSAVGGAQGAAKGAWLGLTTGNPFDEVENFKSVMKKFNKMLKKLSPSEAKRVKQEVCKIINLM